MWRGIRYANEEESPQCGVEEKDGVQFGDGRLVIRLLRACGMIRRLRASRPSPKSRVQRHQAPVGECENRGQRHLTPVRSCEFQATVLGINLVPPAVNVVLPLVNLFERAYV